MTKETKKRSKYLGAYINESLTNRLKAYIEHNGGNISWFVGKAIEEKLDRSEDLK